MQSTSIITCENPRSEPNVLKITLSHFKNIIRVQTLLHPVPRSSIVHTSIVVVLVLLPPSRCISHLRLCTATKAKGKTRELNSFAN